MERVLKINVESGIAEEVSESIELPTFQELVIPKSDTDILKEQISDINIAMACLMGGAL